MFKFKLCPYPKMFKFRKKLNQNLNIFKISKISNLNRFWNFVLQNNIFLKLDVKKEKY
jgi:hypothetical protein